MRHKLQLLVAMVAAGGIFAAGALAAAPPSAVTGNATSISDTSAVLHGTVTPNGSATTYYFQWGPTTSYGNNRKTKNAGSGTKASSVTQTITKLKPGTLYHYRLVATNKSGTTMGSDQTFTTAAPSVATGAATNLSTTGATLTGSLNPNGKKTSWYFEWGTSGTFNRQTPTETIAGGNTSQPVTASLTGLMPATVYQYRLVASHPDGAKIYGNTVLTMTYPTVRPYAIVTAFTTPRHRVLYPYVFKTTGTISGGAIPPQFACIGEVTLRFYRGTSFHQVRFETARVRSNCTYSAKSVFYHLPAGTHAPARLRVVVHFVATPYLARTKAPIQYVKMG